MGFDLVVIGSGPGGYSAAVRASQYGLRTAIIEKDPKLGGTCLHVGCIPTKALLHTADVWEHFLHPEADGIECQNPRLNYPKVIDRKNGIVAKHAKGVEFLMKKNKIEWIKGRATLKGGGKIEVSGEKGAQTVEAKNIIIATGSEARMLPGLQPDPEFILTNIEILNLTAVPKSLAIIGAGAVGVEFASIFHRFGCKVTVLEMLPRVVPVEDEEISKELERVFKKQGIRVETGAKVENVRKTGDGVALTMTLAGGKQEELEAEKLLVAVARIAGKPTTPLNRSRIPSATYTEPGIGSVGMTEAQARAQGRKVKVGKFPYVANSKATIIGQHDGFVKIVADEEHGEILGVHIIGPSAFESIAEAVAAMESEATVETLMATVHAHPTLYEAVGEAFNAVYGLAINA